MGAVKIRKKNGTYPTREQMEQAARRNTEVWYPTAADLPLTHIPEEARPLLRKRLEPWLANLTHTGGMTMRVGIKGGQCYRVAQSLVLTAKDPNVKYVEGMWGHGSAHGWAMVDGHRVDLINELYVWRDGDEAVERLYEPFQEFSNEEVRDYLIEDQGYNEATLLHYERKGDYPSFGIAHGRWLDDGNGLDVHTCHHFDGSGSHCDCDDHSVMCKQWEDCDCENDVVMAPALQRLKERLKADEQFAA